VSGAKMFLDKTSSGVSGLRVRSYRRNQRDVLQPINLED